MKNIKNNVAFTLAEVLITLGIIGVVSAMTIPTLITKHQKMVIEKRVTQDYSMIQQVLRMQTADGLELATENVIDGNTTYIKNWYDKYWKPYLKTTKVCFDTVGCWQDLGPNRSLSGNTVILNYGAKGIGNWVITVRLLNGTSMCIDSWYPPNPAAGYFGINTAYTFLIMYIDANGDKAPNIIGKDIYIYVWTREAGLVPAGYNRTPAQIRANCSKDATGSTAGYYCLSRVKLDGWKILDEVWKR